MLRPYHVLFSRHWRMWWAIVRLYVCSGCKEIRLIEQFHFHTFITLSHWWATECKHCTKKIYKFYGKVGSLEGWMRQTIQILSKDALNKSCSELNFLQKAQWTHIMSPRSGASGIQRLSCLKYYNTLKWASRFTLGLNAAAKNTVLSKKKKKNASNKSCLELNFLQKTQWTHVSISPCKWSLGLPKIVILEILHSTTKICSTRDYDCS